MFGVHISDLSREEANKLIERGERFYVFSTAEESNVLSGDDSDDNTDSIWDDRDIAEYSLPAAYSR